MALGGRGKISTGQFAGPLKRMGQGTSGLPKKAPGIGVPTSGEMVDGGAGGRPNLDPPVPPPPRRNVHSNATMGTKSPDNLSNYQK